MKDLLAAADVALSAAREAAEIVMTVYATPFDVHYKAVDDPVTRADRESNALLCERLERAYPGVPVVAEESAESEYAGFAKADAVWFVDPLDGTREFVAKNGEFAVMIGLSVGGGAALGVIVAPAWGRSFVGVVGQGAWEAKSDGARVPLHVSSKSSLGDASIVLSRSRVSPRLAAQIDSLGAREVVRHGSSGLKGVLVALGTHDAYLQPGRAGMRWDACATEALVRAAGGRCTDATGAPIDYASEELVNSRGLVATNGALHDAVVAALRSDPHA
jgi:3'(2'), 5'-bisphosphate nucleotidase